MKILVLNCGSSSIKYQLIDMEDKKNHKLITKGNYEMIGTPNSKLTIKINGEKIKFDHPAKDFEEGIAEILNLLISDEYKILKSLDEIGGVGHRVVHGGVNLIKSCLVDEKVHEELKQNLQMAPVHNKGSLAGIEACMKLLPNTPMITVFDTSFHQTMEPKVYLYQLPYEYYEDHKIRKYGFHGISHRYVAQRLAEIYGRNNLKIINCHLGQGASLCAIKDGKSMDTTMGMTPLAGIPMGTRSGDIDPSIIPMVMKIYNYTPDEMNDIINKKSGVLAVSGISADFRDIEEAAANGHERAQLALDSRAYIIAQYIAKFIVTLQGVDVISFAGGIGENGLEERERICKYLECFGIYIDTELNNQKGKEMKISKEGSKADIYVVPTNEELLIAQDVYDIVNQ